MGRRLRDAGVGGPEFCALRPRRALLPRSSCPGWAQVESDPRMLRATGDAAASGSAHRCKAPLSEPHAPQPSRSQEAPLTPPGTSALSKPGRRALLGSFYSRGPGRPEDRLLLTRELCPPCPTQQAGPEGIPLRLTENVRERKKGRGGFEEEEKRDRVAE